MARIVSVDVEDVRPRRLLPSRPGHSTEMPESSVAEHRDAGRTPWATSADAGAAGARTRVPG